MIENVLQELQKFRTVLEESRSCQLTHFKTTLQRSNKMLELDQFLPKLISSTALNWFGQLVDSMGKTICIRIWPGPMIGLLTLCRTQEILAHETTIMCNKHKQSIATRTYLF